MRDDRVLWGSRKWNGVLENQMGEQNAMASGFVKEILGMECKGRNN